MKHKAEYYEKVARLNNWTRNDVTSGIKSWFGRAVANWECYDWLSRNEVSAHTFKELMK